MKRRNFLRSIGVGTVAWAVSGTGYALARDNSRVGSFEGTIVLGNPTDCGITLNVLSNKSLEVYFEYGTQLGIYTDQTLPSLIAAL